MRRNAATVRINESLSLSFSVTLSLSLSPSLSLSLSRRCCGGGGELLIDAPQQATSAR